MNKTVKRFSEQFQESLFWLLPVGLIITTFIILFFGISEQVGQVKSINYYLIAETNKLKEKVSTLEKEKVSFNDNVPTKDNPGTPTIFREYKSINSVSVSTQKLNLTDKLYWGFSFPNATAGLTAERISSYDVEDKGIRSRVITMSLRDENKIPVVFELFEYNEATKSIKINDKSYNQILVFVNGQVVLFNDFNTNSSAKIKDLLNAIKQSQSIPAEIKNAASSELSKF